MTVISYVILLTFVYTEANVKFLDVSNQKTSKNNRRAAESTGGGTGKGIR